jgi:secondary thiamine-phosphate synthase enzyme
VDGLDIEFCKTGCMVNYSCFYRPDFLYVGILISILITKISILKKMIQQKEITLPAFRRGYHLITKLIEENLPELPAAGLLHILVKHTSAGITLNENADPTVRTDFEGFMNKMIPENDPVYLHNEEGSDDMPAHLKSSVIGAEITIPITRHRLNLGIWQGIYFCEFRNFGGSRKLVLTIFS